MVADHWFMQVEKVLEAMEIASDTTRIKLAAFQIEGEAQVWWNWAKTSRDLEAMTWAEFHGLSIGKSVIRLWCFAFIHCCISCDRVRLRG